MDLLVTVVVIAAMISALLPSVIQAQEAGVTARSNNVLVSISDAADPASLSGDEFHYFQPRLFWNVDLSQALVATL